MEMEIKLVEKIIKIFHEIYGSYFFKHIICLKIRNDKIRFRNTKFKNTANRISK